MLVMGLVTVFMMFSGGSNAPMTGVKGLTLMTVALITRYTLIPDFAFDTLTWDLACASFAILFGLGGLKQLKS